MGRHRACYTEEEITVIEDDWKSLCLLVAQALESRPWHWLSPLERNLLGRVDDLLQSEATAK